LKPVSYGMMKGGKTIGIAMHRANGPKTPPARKASDKLGLGGPLGGVGTQLGSLKKFFQFLCRSSSLDAFDGGQLGSQTL
jgi:hypothetical protein